MDKTSAKRQKRSKTVPAKTMDPRPRRNSAEPPKVAAAVARPYPQRTHADRELEIVSPHKDALLSAAKHKEAMLASKRDQRRLSEDLQQTKEKLAKSTATLEQTRGELGYHKQRAAKAVNSSSLKTARKAKSDYASGLKKKPTSSADSTAAASTSSQSKRERVLSQLGLDLLKERLQHNKQVNKLMRNRAKSRDPLSMTTFDPLLDLLQLPDEFIADQAKDFIGDRAIGTYGPGTMGLAMDQWCDIFIQTAFQFFLKRGGDRQGKYSYLRTILTLIMDLKLKSAARAANLLKRIFPIAVSGRTLSRKNEELASKFDPVAALDDKLTRHRSTINIEGLLDPSADAETKRIAKTWPRVLGVVLQGGCDNLNLLVKKLKAAGKEHVWRCNNHTILWADLLLNWQYELEHPLDTDFMDLLQAAVTERLTELYPKRDDTGQYAEPQGETVLDWENKPRPTKPPGPGSSVTTLKAYVKHFLLSGGYEDMGRKQLERLCSLPPTQLGHLALWSLLPKEQALLDAWVLKCLEDVLSSFFPNPSTGPSGSHSTNDNPPAQQTRDQVSGNSTPPSSSNSQQQKQDDDGDETEQATSNTRLLTSEAITILKQHYKGIPLTTSDDTEVPIHLFEDTFSPATVGKCTHWLEHQIMSKMVNGHEFTCLLEADQQGFHYFLTQNNQERRNDKVKIPFVPALGKWHDERGDLQGKMELFFHLGGQTVLKKLKPTLSSRGMDAERGVWTYHRSTETFKLITLCLVFCLQLEYNMEHKVVDLSQVGEEQKARKLFQSIPLATLKEWSAQKAEEVAGKFGTVHHFVFGVAGLFWAGHQAMRKQHTALGTYVQFLTGLVRGSTNWIKPRKKMAKSQPAATALILAYGCVPAFARTGKLFRNTDKTLAADEVSEDDVKGTKRSSDGTGQDEKAVFERVLQALMTLRLKRAADDRLGQVFDVKAPPERADEVLANGPIVGRNAQRGDRKELSRSRPIAAAAAAATVASGRKRGLGEGQSRAPVQTRVITKAERRAGHALKVAAELDFRAQTEAGKSIRLRPLDDTNRKVHESMANYQTAGQPMYEKFVRENLKFGYNLLPDLKGHWKKWKSLLPILVEKLDEPDGDEVYETMKTMIKNNKKSCKFGLGLHNLGKLKKANVLDLIVKLKKTVEVDTEVQEDAYKVVLGYLDSGAIEGKEEHKKFQVALLDAYTQIFRTGWYNAPFVDEEEEGEKRWDE